MTDRPGDWGPLYERVIAAARRTGDLVVLEGAGAGGTAYLAANERILDQALHLAGVAADPGAAALGPVAPEVALAVIVWEGQSRGDDDASAQFATSARRRGLAVEEVLTI
ncbi:MAG: hypothetical protein K0R41_4698 [Geminicoccaceae bacterium]|nr:hypothetical protein [Geminicoccaceae bacterium]